MKLVIDASMTLAWLFERSKKEEALCADRALLAIADTETRIPSLWHTEVANALLIGERRKIVTEAQVIDYLDRVFYLPLITDDVTPASRRDRVMALAREHGLTAYDATYLELALRTNSVLATFDNRLIDAMLRAGGDVFGNSN
jgi:predicted nucleic acid-binding protein